MDMALEHTPLEKGFVLLGPVGGVAALAFGSAQTPEPVLLVLIRSGNRAPSWALAALASQVRIKPCDRSMPMRFL
jgi:hypothetical protein